MTKPNMSTILPKVRHAEVDGARCVAVQLLGKRGAGNEMTLDLEDWLRISEDVTPFWTTQHVGGAAHVVSTRRAALKAVGLDNKKGGMAFVSRLIAKAEPGQIVTFANGRRDDLRKANLIVGRREELIQLAHGARSKNAAAKDADVRQAVKAANAKLREAA